MTKSEDCLVFQTVSFLYNFKYSTEKMHIYYVFSTEKMLTKIKTGNKIKKMK